MNRLIRNPIVVTAVFAGIFILLIESGSSAARLAGTGVLLTAILAMSVMAVTKMIRRRTMRTGTRVLLPPSMEHQQERSPNVGRRAQSRGAVHRRLPTSSFSGPVSAESLRPIICAASSQKSIVWS